MRGEPPPPRPRACFGRDTLIEEIVDLTEDLTPLALIGPGGIGKTSIALTVLHHDRVKKRFGNDRRFIRCDKFPASSTHLLSRLSKVIGAGVENPQDLSSLRAFLSSREMIIFLDNAESILDPQGTDAHEIYVMVEELSEFDNICLCLTSRISTIPSACETLDIPTLSMKAAHEAFYRIYKGHGRSDPVNNVLEVLDFHPLSITLLATVAHQSKWDTDRLAKEWGRRRTDSLCTQHNNSLAATIELSLASPMFQALGPDARGLLGVVAFFPQGIDKNNLDWLFPTFPDRINIFDAFCVLSLTHRDKGLITMLSPLRDYLCTKDPASSPLLHAVKEHYFHRFSVNVDPGEPGFKATRWIVSEDVNIEHLLDIFTSIDTNAVGPWDVCARFMHHLYWHKPRLVVLGPKIEGLPDDHPSKPECLFWLSRLFASVGKPVEAKRLQVDALKLWRERGSDIWVAHTLTFISDTNRWLNLYNEGIEQAKEALETYKRLDNIWGQGQALQRLAWLLYADEQLDAAGEATLQAIDLLLDTGEQFLVCDCHHLLGNIYHSKDDTEKAIDHFETAIRIASTFDWFDHLFWNNYNLADLFFDEGRSSDAHVRVECAKLYATNVNDQFQLGRAMELQAWFWYEDSRFEEAKSEALRAAEVFEGIGATKDLEYCKTLLQDIEEEMETPDSPGKLDFDGFGELVDMRLLPTPANSLFSA